MSSLARESADEQPDAQADRTNEEPAERNPPVIVTPGSVALSISAPRAAPRVVVRPSSVQLTITALKAVTWDRRWHDPHHAADWEQSPTSTLFVPRHGGLRTGAGAKPGDRLAELRALLEKTIYLRQSGTPFRRKALRYQVNRTGVVSIDSVAGLDAVIRRCRGTVLACLSFEWLRTADLDELQNKLDSV